MPSALPRPIPPLHKIGFSYSGGMQNRSFRTKHPPRYTNLMRWSPRPMSCLSLMYGQRASVVNSCSTLGPEVRCGTQNAITQKITERLSHHSAGQPFRNPIIIKQLRATKNRCSQRAIFRPAKRAKQQCGPLESPLNRGICSRQHYRALQNCRTSCKPQSTLLKIHT